MKNIIWIALFLFTTFYNKAQIVVGGKEQVEIKPIKKDKGLNDSLKVKDGASSLYFVANWSHTDRKLVSNTNYFGDTLGDRVNEKPLNVWSYGFGIQNSINSFLMWDGGIAYSRNGEQIEKVLLDSTFRYKTYYNYISLPLRLNFQYGNDFKLIAGVGLAPQLFSSFRQEQSWSTSKGVQGKETIKTQSGYNMFVLHAVFNLGFRIKFHRNWSLLLSSENKIQLNSSYLEQDDFIHKSRIFGITMGLIYHL